MNTCCDANTQEDLDPMLDPPRGLPSLDVAVEELDVERGPDRADALISIRSPAGPSSQVAEAKRTITTSTVPAVGNQLGRSSRQIGRPPLLLAPYLTPGVTERLVDEGIEFADSAGRVSLAGPSAHVLVRTELLVHDDPRLRQTAYAS